MKKAIFFNILITLTIFILLLNNSGNLNNQSSLKTNSINYMDTVIISEDNDGTPWNNGNSIDANIDVDIFNRIHVVWEDNTDGIWGNDTEIMYSYYTEELGWSNTTVISDGFNGTYWNNGSSMEPSISVNNNGIVYVVWKDWTNGTWGNDTEIMYSSSLDGIEWSNATVISDGFNGTYWNDGDSNYPDIIVDNSSRIHVVWEDNTNGIWGMGPEIMYLSSTDGISWSNASVISDGYNGTYSYSRSCFSPEITVDSNGKRHIVWSGTTDGIWGADMDILYSSSTDGIIWSNATVISDGFNGTEWNDGWSFFPSIAVNNIGELNVVWMDETDGNWDNNTEIMYVSSNDGYYWSNITIISDDETGWNNGDNWIPKITIDQLGNPYVIWQGHTNGKWGNDAEIMLTRFNNISGWSNITIISDGYNGVYWNDDNSANPSMAFDTLGNLHIVWSDGTDGIWGNDIEIMYIFFSMQPIPIPIDFYYINLVLSLLILGITGILLLYDNKSKINFRSFRKKTFVNGTNLLLSASIISIQIIQINYNRENEINLFSDNYFVFIIPYFLLLIGIILLILISISLVITLKEYKSYLKTKDIENISFRKITFDKIFENENRQNIIENILNNSGIHYNELLRECDLSHGQLQWHLRVLLEYGIIKKRKIGQYNLFYPIREKYESKRYNDILIKSDTSLTILDIIEKNPGIIPSVIADNLNFQRSTINYHIHKLEKKKLITSIKEGRFLKLYIKK
ncbi:MAG: winged helix-turn-helix transcriptional regulator [Candidatus Lokiarchaeota archaeon]|nr:winged helix-turn-helix transcriptional regulator [Candidatus Lokiarchaeota archaeon]